MKRTKITIKSLSPLGSAGVLIVTGTLIAFAILGVVHTCEAQVQQDSLISIGDLNQGDDITLSASDDLTFDKGYDVWITDDRGKVLAAKPYDSAWRIFDAVGAIEVLIEQQDRERRQLGEAYSRLWEAYDILRKQKPKK